MNVKVAFAAALILAVVAVIGAKQIITSFKAEVQDSQNMVSIVIAAQNLPVGSTLLYEHMRFDSVPARAVTRSMIPSNAIEPLIGRQLVEYVPQGEPLREEHFYRRPTDIAFTSSLPRGHRAITMAVDQVSGLSGLIKPRDRVDIIATLVYASTGPSGTRSVVETITILENIAILATDNRTHDHMALPERLRGDRTSRTGYTTVTLAVTPEEARILTLAQSQSQGMLTLTLRNPTDISSDIPDPIQTEPVTQGRVNIDTLRAAIERTAQTRRAAAAQRDTQD